MCVGMSGMKSDPDRFKRYACEFARDCMTEDSVHCPVNPDECLKFVGKALAEGEISKQEADRLLAELGYSVPGGSQ
jgi:hypothetical protein